MVHMLPTESKQVKSSNLTSLNNASAISPLLQLLNFGVMLWVTAFGTKIESSGEMLVQATVGDGLEAVAELAHCLNSTQRTQTQPKLRETQSSKANSSSSREMSNASNSGQHSNGGVPTNCHQLDLLVVDAGSGDATVAMSCPPAAFLAATFLGQAKRVLRPGGMLVVNCVSRADEPYRAAVNALQVSHTHTVSATLCDRFFYSNGTLLL